MSRRAPRGFVWNGIAGDEVKKSVVLTWLVVLVVTAGCGEDGTGPPTSFPTTPPERPDLPRDYRPSGHAASGDVFVHLFEWPWTDIAAECETVLAPAGYDAVQVSPPQEHALIGGSPWWQRYQPVSYALESRSGGPAEFEAMVERCDAVGVDIYVDAVINHMTAGSGVGSAGTEYTKYDYPGLYDPTDFHPACTVTNYQSAENVQDCELLGLADLHTGLADVRSAIADYLVELVRLGVAGFRIDAAKHIQPVELDSILDLVNERVAAEGLPRPYWFAEVIDHGGEAVRAQDYFGLAHGTGGAADITEFRYRGVGDKVQGAGGQSLSELRDFSPGSWGLIPADKAVVFLQNHDTQRQGGLGYRDPQRYRLGHVWLLAWPYGYPKVMSGYAFTTDPVGRDMGPPSNEEGETLPVECALSLEAAGPGEWVCEHRDPLIRAMTGFRQVVAGTDVDDWWDDGANAIAFSRGDRGFVAMNAGADPVVVRTGTPMSPGQYCDLTTGGVGAGGGCVGDEVTVGEDGMIERELGPLGAVVLHVEARP